MLKNVTDLVTAVRDLYGSDRKAAVALDVSQTTFSRWRAGRDFPTDDYAIRMAELLQIDPALAVALVRMDRAPSDRARQVWARVRDAFAVALLAVGAVSFPAPGHAALNINGFAESQNTHCGRRWRAALRLLGMLP